MIDGAENVPAAGGSSRRLWLGVFAAAAALYLLTAQRGPSWQDSGVFQWRIHTFDLTGWLGLALAHPVVMLLGRAAAAVPVGTEAWRLNALSGLAAAVAAANLALLVRRLAPKVPVAAWFAAGAFALAHTVWWLATITESHAVLAAIVSGELLALTSLLRRPRPSMVLLLGLLNGVALATHNLALLALPAYGLAVLVPAVRGRLKWWAVPAFIAAWAVGASPLLVLVGREAARSGLAEAVRSALFGASWRGEVLGSGLSRVPRGLAYVAYNLPNLTVPLAAVGLWRLRRRVGRAAAGAIAYILAAHLLFAVRYGVTDQFMFFVPFYLLASLAAGLGLAELAARRRWLGAAACLSLALGPAAYAAAPRIVRAMDVSLPGTRRTLPYRDHARYWLTPWKHDEDSAERFAAAAIDQLRRHGGRVVLVADNTAAPPLLWAARARGPGPDELRIVGGRPRPEDKPIRDGPAEAVLAELAAGGWSVWVVSNVRGYCPAPLLPYVDPEPTGVLYRVRPPRP